MKRPRLWPVLADAARLAILRVRFMRHVTHDGYTDCWLWTGYVCKRGYGRWWRGRGISALAHRGAYELFRGPILPGLEADHTCNVAICVNPWHVQPITHAAHKRRHIKARRIKRLRYRRPQKP